MTQKESNAPGVEKAGRIATVTVPLERGELLLLGTFGSEKNPGALVRLPNGKTRKIAPGDSVGGKTVVAVANGSVVMASSGAAQTLRLPGEGKRQASGRLR